MKESLIFVNSNKKMVLRSAKHDKSITRKLPLLQLLTKEENRTKYTIIQHF